MKEIIDAHLHCSLQGNDKQEQIKQLKSEMKRYHIEKGVLYFIDENDFAEQNYALAWGKNIIPGIMLDPHDGRIEEKLEELKRRQVRLVKLLPYEQKLLYEDYEAVCKFAQKIQEHGRALPVWKSIDHCARWNGTDIGRLFSHAGI